MRSANEIVRRNKEIEAEKLNKEFGSYSKGKLLKSLKDLEAKLQELIDCDGCRKRRAKIKKMINNIKAFLKISGDETTSSSEGGESNQD